MSANEELALVKIDANAEKEFVPDKIELTLSFSDELEETDECVAQYNKDLETVLAALESVGIDRTRVKQSGFKVYPKRETAYKKIEEDDKERYYRAFEYISGYEYEGESSVDLDADPNVFGTAWLALLQAKGQFTFEFSYGLKDRAKAEAELLQEAVNQAKVRAEVLSAAAGAQLGSVHEISHSVRNAALYSYSDDWAMECRECPSGAPDFMTPNFNPEPISVSCSVSCAWRLV